MSPNKTLFTKAGGGQMHRPWFAKPALYFQDFSSLIQNMGVMISVSLLDQIWASKKLIKNSYYIKCNVYMWPHSLWEPNSWCLGAKRCLITATCRVTLGKSLNFSKWSFFHHKVDAKAYLPWVGNVTRCCTVQQWVGGVLSGRKAPSSRSSICGFTFGKSFSPPILRNP
jgi:hypothetical protein